MKAAVAGRRRPTRDERAQDVPPFDASTVSVDLRPAIAELLLSMADDEFVQGFLDSEWTGIAPMLEEDVAFSSLAQDEIGHARAFYELRSRLTGDDPDEVAFGRPVDAYRHCCLLDHPRTDWAFSVARRYLYDTADHVRLGGLTHSSFRSLAELVVKVRREETYHLVHLDAWVRRLAEGGDEARGRLQVAFDRLWPDALSVFAPLDEESTLLDAGVIAEPFSALAARQWEHLRATLVPLGVAMPPTAPDATEGRTRTEPAPGFAWLWNEFTSVRRDDPKAAW